MFDRLQIYEARERALVGLADLALGAVTWPWRIGGRGTGMAPPARVLVLRLERIGDLLMVADALAALRAALPAAHIDLVVGSWNAALAGALGVVDVVESLDAPWLARGAVGATWPAMIARARSWRRRGYDLAINLEPDIRSNLLIGLSGAARRVGYWTGGGGALLTDALAYDPTAHTRDNAVRLVTGIVPPGTVEAPDATAGRGLSPGATARLTLPAEARAQADRLLGPRDGRRLIAVHASGGRAIKQWPVERFAEVAARLGREFDATIVLTGTTTDEPLVRQVQSRLPAGLRVLDLCGDIDLLALATVLARCDLLVTGDTGPMHLAAAVGTPTAAVFGPSDPARYRPLVDRHRVVRIDLPCAPCNRIRRPPVRCQGGVPDCLAGIDVGQVLAAARELLATPPRASSL